METSAEMLYLVKFADKNDTFGFKDEKERNQCLQWTFFWHGSGAPYQGTCMCLAIARVHKTNFSHRPSQSLQPCSSGED